MEKLYVIVRADLKPGDQLAQAGHAVAAFARKRRSLFEAWTDGPNNLVVLAIDDEYALGALSASFGDDHGTVRVREPDLRDELTAIAFEGTDWARRAVSSLPLALRPSPPRAA